jgi:amino acid permease
MTISLFIPSWRGCLALAVGLADYFWAPAYDLPISRPEFFSAILLAAITVFVCFLCFHKRRTADRVAAVITAVFAAWIFYESIVFYRAVA